MVLPIFKVNVSVVLHARLRVRSANTRSKKCFQVPYPVMSGMLSFALLSLYLLVFAGC